MPTPSEVARLKKCKGSLWLPNDRGDTRYTRAGNERHHWVADYLKQGRLPHGMPQRLVPLDSHIEQAMALDLATGTARLLDVENRQYNGTATEICGTADLLGIEQDHVVVGDWKGWEEVDDAQVNDQLLTYAVMWALICGKRKVFAWIAHTVEIKDHAGNLIGVRVTRLDSAWYSAEQLNEHLASLRAVIIADQNLSPGKHCRYCPSYVSRDASGEWSFCPAIRKGNRAIEGSAGDELVPEDSTSFWYTYQHAQMLAKRSKEALESYVTEESPIKVDGGMLRLVDKKGNRAIVNPKLAYEVAANFMTKEQLDHAFNYSAAIGKFEDVLPKKQAIAVIKELETAGAIARSKGTSAIQFIPDEDENGDIE